MLRARRLASTAVVAVLAATGLAACNRAPDVAVYFGDKKAVTESEVQRVWDDSIAKLTEDADGKLTMSVSRQTIVSVELYIAALRQIGKDEGFTATPEPATDLATSYRMKPDAAFITLAGEFRGWLSAFEQRTTAGGQPAPISDADLRDIYAKIKAAGYPDTYEKLKSMSDQVLVQQGIGSAIVARNQLRDHIAGLHIKINPRYQAPTLALAPFPNTEVTIVDVSFGTGAVAPVKDLS